MPRLRVLTWHVHGNYLWYLSSIPHDIFLPVRAGAPEGYGGRGASFTWPDNVHEVPAEAVRDLEVDVVVTQSHRNWLEDRPAILSPAQLGLPHVHIEHDPPRASPTDTPHPIDDPSVLIVHVTPFNRLMWDSGRSPTRVIEHGVTVPETARYTGELERGLVVVNGLSKRGRRLGSDVFEEVRRSVPLDLVGMQSEAAGGLGEVPPTELAAFEARYRFFFNPIRWTSLGLAVCEAMMVGLPIVALATTEMATVVENGVSGFVDTDVDRLVGRMHQLLGDPGLARELGEGARRAARQRFSIDRFAADWDATLRDVAQPAAGTTERTNSSTLRT
ncbi:MAG: Glycosyltransferase [uncultured Acidimicrobiales bacterium]|uniref:Glycosyltransferase n=1 Tax=uncultured Acidimicrobiales bacterium TaxID=310071 RepID=A0A6J4JCC6_9ACTN|nr:MAG: Glycosyltransferase [uncultured Acidimicrobiales bacterium]